MTNDEWFDAMGVDELPQDDVVAVEINGREIAISTVNGAVYATDNTCTHGQARLSDGFLDGCALECPLHQGKFDVRDGKPMCEPAVESLRTYGVRIDGSRVYLKIT
jgi:naphthalene 1,2-dioxygenase system ferredoxin subunit